ncbi:uncharacterized protein A4U43_C02F19520 [Asparagus officinalis]|uniref:TFIIS N-terminal domain-containing protein n=1 Tax=Asparagus officinalis TaxID=4686 RepID=A0A5P1FJQ2_ASPOF|nr:uncharacterized protein A4U43_C02F19520 [Asparagus officinalis]
MKILLVEYQKRRLDWEALEIKSENLLFESLRLLQLMELSAHTIKATDITSSVKCFLKDTSERIRNFAHLLVTGWEFLLSKWTADTRESFDIYSAREEEIPFDIGDLLASQTSTFDLANFFNGMVDEWSLSRREQKRTGKNIEFFLSEMIQRGSLDYWRKLFRSADKDVFIIIMNAIRVAKADRPRDFITNRQVIIDALYPQDPPELLSPEGKMHNNERNACDPASEESKNNNDNNNDNNNHNNEEQELEVMRIKELLINWQEKVALIILFY